MKLYFIGADHEVTGSCHILEAAGKKIMIDRGMEQGKDIFENADLPYPPSEFDAILLTHAHIDHSGLIPQMVAQGFSGPIYATRATSDLSDLMLRDSAHIQEFEAEWRNEKARKKKLVEAYTPLYTMADAMKAISLFVPLEYGKETGIFDGISVKFTDIGHLLGSACIEINVSETGADGEIISKKLLFSGDVGNVDQPLIRDPQKVEGADYLVIESTYGDRVHGKREDYYTALSGIIQRTFDRGGNVVIPSFAVGRTQELLYFIRHIKKNHMRQGHDGFSVYVDSPLANSATMIFNQHIYDCFDEEAMGLVEKGINPITFPGLKLAITTDESKGINFDNEPKVIISASGMCDAGRIKHHVKNNIWREESTILFVGYQSVGTLGRKIVDGAKTVTIFGENYEVKAEIAKLAGISGHADMNGLLDWVKGFDKRPERVFVVHGEDTVCDSFCETLKTELGHEAVAPYSGAVFDLEKGEFSSFPEGRRIAPKTEKKSASEGGRTHELAFEKLKRTGETLAGIIDRNKGLANKDIAQFQKELEALIERWK